MAEDFMRGKSMESVAKDIAEGFVIVNPIFLKKFTPEVLKKLLAGIDKTLIFIRNERFPTHDVDAIKRRNMRLSRLNNASTIVRHFAKERRWIL